MSTISIATPTVLTVRPATRLRLTARGRRVLLALAAVPLAAAIVFAAISSGAASASGESTTGVAGFETVTVMPGDTLWSIAAGVAPHADPRAVIAEIQSLNLLQGGVLMVGQELALPTAFTE